MSGAPLLKERETERYSIHADRLSDARWAMLAAALRRELKGSALFKPWEIDAIVDSMIEVVRETGRVDEDKLASTLHSKQFSLPSARQFARSIAHAYGGR